MSNWQNIPIERPDNPAEPQNPEPVPCVFCGAKEAVVQQLGGSYRVQCPICKGSGPECVTVPAATFCWARRRG